MRWSQKQPDKVEGSNSYEQEIKGVAGRFESGGE
jgi:hypothetical protein